MMKGGHGQTNQSRVINWDALNHAFRAPQLMSCNYHNIQGIQWILACTCNEPGIPLI